MTTPAPAAPMVVAQATATPTNVLSVTITTTHANEAVWLAIMAPPNDPRAELHGDGGPGFEGWIQASSVTTPRCRLEVFTNRIPTPGTYTFTPRLATAAPSWIVAAATYNGVDGRAVPIVGLGDVRGKGTLRAAPIDNSIAGALLVVLAAVVDDSGAFTLSHADGSPQPVGPVTPTVAIPAAGGISTGNCAALLLRPAGG